MPELPEVETTLRGITTHVTNQKISKIEVRQDKLRWPIPKNIGTLVKDQIIHECRRRGKYLLFTLNSGTIILHLGMSGSLRLLDLDHDLTLKKHDHLDIVFTNHKILRFNDPRRFGCLLWTENPDSHPLLKNLGTEPLSKTFTGNYLHSQIKTKSSSIKSILMNNKIVTGIGNIYAAEALYASGIYPNVAAKSLSIERLNILVNAIKCILRQAIKRGGTTIKDFINSEGKPGYFANDLRVYGREKMPCLQCHALLESIQINQRTTVYCRYCQN